MKKWIAFILVVACVMSLAACNNAEQEQAVTYSFHGECDSFTIVNGLIVLGDKEEVFDGGDLEVVQSDLFADVASFSTTFYTVRDEEKFIILSNSVIDQTGGEVSISEDLGQKVGSDVIGGDVETFDNLWFELETTDLNGTKNVYDIQLTLKER